MDTIPIMHTKKPINTKMSVNDDKTKSVRFLQTNGKYSIVLNAAAKWNFNYKCNVNKFYDSNIYLMKFLSSHRLIYSEIIK